MTRPVRPGANSDMDQAFDARLQFDERPKVGRSGHLAGDNGSRRIVHRRLVPRAFGQLPQPHREFAVEGSIRSTITRTRWPSFTTSEGSFTRFQLTSETGNGAIDSAQVHERAERPDRPHHAFAHLSLGHLGPELLAQLGHSCSSRAQQAQHQVSVLAVNLGHHAANF